MVYFRSLILIFLSVCCDFEKFVYVLLCLAMAAIVLKADEGEYTRRKSTVVMIAGDKLH